MKSFSKNLGQPIFDAIKRAIESEEKYTALIGSETIFYFCERAYLSDLPDRLKEKAIASARKAAGEEDELTALRNNEATYVFYWVKGLEAHISLI